MGGQKLLVAVRLRRGIGLARRSLPDAGLGGQLVRLFLLEGGLLGHDAVVKIHGVYFAQQLARFNLFAHVHIHRFDPPGHGWTDFVSVAGFDRADAEQGRGEGTVVDRGDRHRHRRQRPGP